MAGTDRWTEEDLARYLAKLQQIAALAPKPALVGPESAQIQRSRRSKYGAEPCEVEGLRFDSKKEGARYADLRLLEKVGAIRELEPSPERPMKPKYDLIASNGEVIGHYTGDFRFFDVRSGQVVVEDVKSPQTRKNTAYRLRKRLLRACWGIEIREI